MRKEVHKAPLSLTIGTQQIKVIVNSPVTVTCT